MATNEIAAQEKPNKAEKPHVLKTLAQFMKGGWRFVFLTWAFIFVEVICEVFIPYLSEFMVDAISGIENRLPIWFYAVTMAALAILSCSAGIVAGLFAAIASARFSRNVRQGMYYKIQEFSFKNIDKFSTPSLVTRLTTDVSNVQGSFQAIVRIVVRAPFMLIFALTLAGVKSWQLSLVFLFVIPFLAFVLFGIARLVHPTFVKVFKAYDDLNASVQENLHGIRVVKSFAREDFEKEKFGKVSYFIYRTFIKAERLLALNGPAMQLSIYACILVISYFGAQMIVATNNQAEFSTGTLASLFQYIMQILMSLMMVSMVFVMIIISRNSAERIVEVLHEVPDLASPENPIKEIPNGEVVFDHVDFRYNETSEKLVLADINITIPSGSTVGIIGATGSSKSSFVSLIARLYDVTGGEVRVGGHNVKEYDLEALRDSVAVVLQKNVLFSGTIKSNLQWGNPNATDEEIKKAAKLACADEFIEKLPQKYDSPIEQGGTNVSGGQRQRLCIARALLKNPKILILDDSTSAVDTQTDAKIRRAFQTEIPHVTKFIVAQRILSIKDCDSIIVLDGGKIVAHGTNDELMKTSEVYREIYETQVGGGDFDAAK